MVRKRQSVNTFPKMEPATVPERRDNSQDMDVSEKQINSYLICILNTNYICV